MGTEPFIRGAQLISGDRSPQGPGPGHHKKLETLDYPTVKTAFLCVPSF